MHELSLAQSVVAILCEEAAKYQLTRIERFTLEVGQLRAIVPELLLTCLQFASKGTAAEGAIATIAQVPGQARCRACGVTFAVEELMFLCPECNTVGGIILTGEELRVVELEGEES